MKISRVVPLQLRRKLPGLAKFYHRKNLTKLAMLYGTEKWGAQWYTEHYQRYFEPLRTKPINLLEIGVGGEDDAAYGGHSLRMWERFFPKAQIVGIDIHDKRHFSTDRVDIRVCDQTDSASLRELSAEYGGFDIIIDDGSHINWHVIKTFETLFPLLRPDGIYAIEDTQTSYWPSYGGGGNDTMLSYFKGLTDGINYMEYGATPEVDSLERTITEISFFRSLVIIRKGRNDKPSNLPQQVALLSCPAAQNSPTHCGD